MVEFASSGAGATEMVAAVNEAALTKSVAELVFDVDFATTNGADLGKAVVETFSKTPYNIDPTNVEFVGVYPGSTVVLLTFKDGVSVSSLSSQDFSVTVGNDTLTAMSAIVCGPQDRNCAMHQQGANAAGGEATDGDNNDALVAIAIAVICVAIFVIAFIAVYYQRKNRSSEKQVPDMTVENGVLDKLTPTSSRGVLANGPFPVRRAAAAPTLYDTATATTEDGGASCDTPCPDAADDSAALSYDTSTSDAEGAYAEPVHTKDQPEYYAEPTVHETGIHVYAGVDYADMNAAGNDIYDEPDVACTTKDSTTSGTFEPNCFVVEGNMQSIRLQSVRRTNPSFRSSLCDDIEVLGPAGIDETAES